MATIYADVARVEGPQATVSATIKNKQFGIETNGNKRLLYKNGSGTLIYFSNDDNPLVTVEGTTDVIPIFTNSSAVGDSILSAYGSNDLLLHQGGLRITRSDDTASLPLLSLGYSNALSAIFRMTSAGQLFLDMPDVTSAGMTINKPLICDQNNSPQIVLRSGNDESQLYQLGSTLNIQFSEGDGYISMAAGQLNVREYLGYRSQVNLENNAGNSNITLDGEEGLWSFQDSIKLRAWAGTPGGGGVTVIMGTGNNNTFSVSSTKNNTEAFQCDENGELTMPLTKITSAGGFAVYMQNDGLSAISRGNIVEASSISANAFCISDANSSHPIGAALTDIAQGAFGYIVVHGIADVLYEDNVASSLGYWVGTSDSEAGVVRTQASPPATAADHFDEVGHSIQAVAAGGGGTNILSRIVMHFN